ncbi:MAG: FkbM family methyltransferase [Planctomycetota bacterium]
MRSLKSPWKDWRRRRLLARAGIVPRDASGTFRAGERSGTWTALRSGLGQGSVVVSAGVGDNVAWDLAMAAEFGCAVHLLDPTPVASAWIRGVALPTGVTFHPVALSAHDGTLRLRPPRKEGGVNFRALTGEECAEAIEVPCLRLASFAAQLGLDRIDVLKLDIEGGELDVLPDVLASDLGVQQVLVEFHHRPDGRGFDRTLERIHELQSSGFELFDVSRRGLEMSFARSFPS